MDIEKIAAGIAAGVVSGAGTAWLAVRSWVNRTEERLKTVDQLELDVAILKQETRNTTIRYTELERRTEQSFETLKVDIRSVSEKLDRLLENRFRRDD